MTARQIEKQTPLPTVLGNRSAIPTFHTGPTAKRMENWKTKSRFPTFPPHDHPSFLKRTTRARPQPRPEDSIRKNSCPRTEKYLIRITRSNPGIVYYRVVSNQRRIASGDDAVYLDKTLGVPSGLEPSHSPLPLPRRLMRVLGPVV
jgi:hypothetical protein